MRFRAIASGSNGNSIFVGTENTSVLVDAGVSCKRIITGVEELGVKGEELSGIFITHEHSDHIQGLKILSKKYHIPIYGTAGTLQAIHAGDTKGEIDPSLFQVVVPGNEYTIGDMTMRTVHTSHDAAEPSAYRFSDGKKSCAVMTDLGTFSQEIVDFLQGLNGILLEANHDIRMLEMGSYPYVLKRRILGDKGHLSNERSGELLNYILNDQLKHILLGHLSEENNYPDIALMSVKNEIDSAAHQYTSGDFDIQVATRYESSQVYSL